MKSRGKSRGVRNYYVRGEQVRVPENATEEEIEEIKSRVEGINQFESAQWNLDKIREDLHDVMDAEKTRAAYIAMRERTREIREDVFDALYTPNEFSNLQRDEKETGSRSSWQAYDQQHDCRGGKQLRKRRQQRMWRWS